MSESPAAKTPYEVLGVSATASDAELKRAYRRALRSAHPDAGGSTAAFQAVQLAWNRVGEKAARAAYDRTRSPGEASGWRDSGSSAAAPRGDSGLRARSHGHPGGYTRELYLRLMREWSGRGAELADPYDPALVRSAPRHLRRLLAEAIAEETTAQLVSGLGVGYTVWNDVATGPSADSAGKIDHVVLGPGGLFTLRSHDWGSAVTVRRGELSGEGVAEGERPVRDLVRAARSLRKLLGVRFTGVILVVPDGSLDDDIVPIGRDGHTAIVTRTALPRVLRDGLTPGARLSVDAVFDVRSRLQRGIRYV